MSLPDDFAVLILTHKRADRVDTYKSLRRCGYTGPIYLVVDDEDPTLAEYEERFPGEVVVFSKREAAEQTDTRTNTGDMRAVVYARNAAHGVAASLGLRSFLELDDDYNAWLHRVLSDGSYSTGVQCDRLDDVFAAMLEFLIGTKATSVALAQGGDLFGGESKILSRGSRKVMNSFFCLVDRPFTFDGMINEDVNAYTTLGMRGHLFLTVGAVHLTQRMTQTNAGGLTDIYKASGTYVKSFYSVLACPSSIVVALLQGQAHSRFHHRVSWRHQVPKILSEEHRKQ